MSAASKTSPRWILGGRELTPVEVDAERASDALRHVASRVGVMPRPVDSGPPVVPASREQLEAILESSHAVLRHMCEKDGVEVPEWAHPRYPLIDPLRPVSPVLKASTWESYRRARREHWKKLGLCPKTGTKREPGGNGAYCSDPKKCLVCSGKGLSPTGASRERTREQNGIPVEVERTSDAPAPTCGKGASSLRSEASQPSGQAGESIDLIEATATTIAKALDQDPDLWLEHVGLHRSANPHIDPPAYVDAAIELANRQANNSGIRSMPRAWSMFVRVLGDMQHLRRQQAGKRLVSVSTPEDDLARLKAQLAANGGAA